MKLPLNTATPVHAHSVKIVLHTAEGQTCSNVWSSELRAQVALVTVAARRCKAAEGSSQAS